MYCILKYVHVLCVYMCLPSVHSMSTQCPLCVQYSTIHYSTVHYSITHWVQYSGIVHSVQTKQDTVTEYRQKWNKKPSVSWSKPPVLLQLSSTTPVSPVVSSLQQLSPQYTWVSSSSPAQCYLLQKVQRVNIERVLCWNILGWTYSYHHFIFTYLYYWDLPTYLSTTKLPKYPTWSTTSSSSHPLLQHPTYLLMDFIDAIESI